MQEAKQAFPDKTPAEIKSDWYGGLFKVETQGYDRQFIDTKYYFEKNKKLRVELVDRDGKTHTYTYRTRKVLEKEIAKQLSSMWRSIGEIQEYLGMSTPPFPPEFFVLKEQTMSLDMLNYAFIDFSRNNVDEYTANKFNDEEITDEIKRGLNKPNKTIGNKQKAVNKKRAKKK